MGVFSFAFLMNCLIIDVAMLNLDGLKSFIFMDFVISMTMMIDDEVMMKTDDDDEKTVMTNDGAKLEKRYGLNFLQGFYWDSMIY